MNANTRIQWIHKKILNNSYPNAQRLAERFRISHRQAQRDLDLLRRKFGAPLAYDNSKKGFYYTKPYALPVLVTSDNDDLYIQDIASVRDNRELAADESIIQMQIPYSATVEIANKLTALELSRYIIARQGKDRYVCEFHSIEKFIGLLLSLDTDFRLIEPYWLRERIVRAARRVLGNNEDQ
jgi:predicted DNA-binding transcriptional regulator YafY